MPKRAILIAVPASPYRALPCRARPLLACLTKRLHASQRLDTPCLPCCATPYRAIRCRNIPSHACLAKPHCARTFRAEPLQPLPAMPRHTKPSIASPRLACLAEPSPTPPRRAPPSLPCQAVQSPAQMRRAMPSLLRRSAYWMLNLALTAASRLLSTTWNRPNPHPALALLSGLPAPIPTCKPQRLTRLITSTILN